MPRFARKKDTARELFDQVALLKLKFPIGEYLFHPERKWRFDLAWPQLLLAVEIEGGVFAQKGSRHTHGVGFTKDCEKYAEAMCLGWTVLRVTTDQVKNGQAIGWLERILSQPLPRRVLA
jgi:very-short-patch-repair endonuclease